MTELGRLIEAASRANNGRTMQEAANIATSLGCPISKSHISKNASRVQSVTPALIRGIAAGYDVTPEDVVRAVLKDLGLTISDYNPTPESAIRRDPSLSSEARAMLLAAIDAARPSRGRRTAAAAQEPQDGGFPPGWRPAGKDAGVLGDENGHHRNQSGS